MPTARQATVEQMSHDVVTFLAWAGNPELVERKQMGVRWVSVLRCIMTGLTYAVKRTGLGRRGSLTGWSPTMIQPVIGIIGGSGHLRHRGAGG